MTYKELMTASLTALLCDGERLMHPIYGILQDGGEQHFGFFGLTDTHLLVALVIGKEVVNGARIPLDVRSVKVKRSLVLRQRIAHIAFSEGAPLKITASPRVLMIDSQKENLPAFLQALAAHAQEAPPPDPSRARGERIRLQYFNGFILLEFSVLLGVPIALAMGELKMGNPDFWGVLIGTLPFLLPGVLVVFVPLLLLSLLNRLFFGKTVCAVSGDSLLLEGGEIPLRHIQKIVYTPDFPYAGRHQISRRHFTRATLYVAPLGGAPYTVELFHFPCYGLKKLKKHNPAIQLRLSGEGLVTVLLLALGPAMISAILPWLML